MPFLHHNHCTARSKLHAYGPSCPVHAHAGDDCDGHGTHVSSTGEHSLRWQPGITATITACTGVRAVANRALQCQVQMSEAPILGMMQEKAVFVAVK
jgi:hypothetical protein